MTPRSPDSSPVSRRGERYEQRSGLGLITLIIVTLALILAARFTGGAAPRSRHDLVLWHSYLGAEQQALERLVRDYNASGRGVHIRLLQVSFDNLPQKLTNAIPRGNGPDLFIFAHDRLGDWTRKKLLEPIGYWVGGDMASRFLPGLLGAFVDRGALYALPLTYKSLALFSNETLVPDPPRTTRQLLALGRRLTDASQGRFGLVYQSTDIYFHAPWLFGFGGRLLERSRGCVPKPALVSDRAVAALEFARKLAGPGGIVPPEVTGQLVASLFVSGKAAMAISGPWFLSQIQAARFPYKVAVLPRVSQTGKPASPLLSVEGIFMSRRCGNKEAAFDFMRYLTSSRSSEFRLRKAGQLPADRATDAQVATIRPLLDAFRRERALARITPSTPVMRLLWRPYSKALAAVLARGKAPRAALKEAQWEVDKFLGSCLKGRACGKEAAR